MKKSFKAPVVDVHIFAIDDVICTSGIQDNVDDMEIGVGSGAGFPEE